MKLVMTLTWRPKPVTVWHARPGSGEGKRVATQLTSTQLGGKR